MTTLEPPPTDNKGSPSNGSPALPRRLLDWLLRNRSFSALVLVPLLLASAYYGLIASDRYESEVKLLVKSGTGQDAASVLSGATLLGMTAPSREDALLLKEHILSQDMLRVLTREAGLRESYTSPDVDWFSRLDADEPFEEYLEYFRKHIDVRVDDMSSVLTVRVQGFTPEMAKRTAEAIVAESDRFITRISGKLAAEQVAFVSEELEQARKAFRASKNTVVAFQDRYKVLDPAEQAKSGAALVSALEAELAKQGAELKTLLSYLTADSYQVKGAQDRVASLKAQIEQERSKLSGNSSKDRLNALASRYLDLQVDSEFALDRYKGALQVLEATRIEASKRLKTLVVISTPHLPEDAKYPRREYVLAVLSAILLMGYGIFRLAAATIKDHMD